MSFKQKTITKSKRKIRTGDKVLCRSGNSRDMTGTVLSVKGEKAIVQGLNVRKRHTKGNRMNQSTILEIERPIHLSNLKVIVEGENAARLKIRKNEDGQRELVYKKDNDFAVYRAIKKPK